MSTRVRIWLSNRLVNGFWFLHFTRSVEWLHKHFSLGGWFKRWLAKDGRNPPGASELYQFAWLALLLIWLFFIDRRVEWASHALVRYVGALVVSYRIIELVLFCLHWVFASPGERLHSTRRSLAMLLGNILEVALATTVIFVLLGCGADISSQWQLAYSNISAAFNVEVPFQSAKLSCRVVSHTQLVASILLVLVLLASLVGAVLRGEKVDGDA